MSTCPFHQPNVREGLPPLIPRIAGLPRDSRGYPIPAFVATLPDGTRDFRIADTKFWARCHNERLCWVCGGKLGQYVTFVIGPMCCISRTTGEPPCHFDCAEWSVKGCPFLTKPQMVRREGGAAEEYKGNFAGEMIERNPGVTALWTCKGYALNKRGYNIFRDPNGKPLIEIGNPESVTWWREGRPATRAEVRESIGSGLPLLLKACELEETAALRLEAMSMLDTAKQRVEQWLPDEPEPSRSPIP